MLEEFQTVLLVGLLVSTYYLTIGCRNIGESLPFESGNITDKVDSATDKLGGMTEVLDDIANLLNDGLHAFSKNGSTHTAINPMEALLTGFISRMTSLPEHGNPTQQEEWEILPPNENDEKTKTETELS
jgi:hypothetical protein